MIEWFKAFGLTLKAWPLIRHLLGERRVLHKPHVAPKDHLDEILERALKRLGLIEQNDPLWVKVTAGITSAFVTTEHTRKPHVRSWVSAHKDDLKQLALLDSEDAEHDCRQRLIDAYMQISGEDQRHAENMLEVISAFLWHAIHAEVKDPGTAAIVQKGFKDIQRTISDQGERPAFVPSQSESAPTVLPSSSLDANDAHRLFDRSSRLLLQWPQETNGRWIERPELAALRQKVTEDSAKPVVLLGSPGSGKSAILARLGNELQHHDAVTLLAIKADELPRNCRTVADIDTWLGCSVVDAVRQFSKSERVVVLIDQLDALADLMDQHGARLGAVLHLARATSCLDNVNVLLTCREFEYQSDLRLSSLDAEHVRLAIPPWDAVEPLLRVSGLTDAHLTDEQRQVLRTPQHLAVFIHYFTEQATPPVFSTYQALLDHVVRHIGTRYGERTVAAAEQIATVMADVEELWVARVRFDAEYRVGMENLIAAGVLVTSADNLSISFRHQTMFDFLRARAFLRDTTGLADYILDARQESLFVRPILWSALAYLRASDSAAYSREFALLWNIGHLRLHIRLLLVSHLAQLQNPSSVEAGWLMPKLSEPVLRRRALTAMAGSPGWFQRMKPRLGTYMAAPSTDADNVAFLLQRALPFARTEVLDWLEEYWLGNDDQCSLAFNVLGAMGHWDTRSTRLAVQFAEQAGRLEVDMAVVRHFVDQMAKAAPASASEVLFAHVAERTTHMTKRAELVRLLRSGHHWYELDKLFATAPETFVRAGWSWLTDTLARLATPPSTIVEEYRGCSELFLTLNEHNTLLSGFASAMRAFADSDVESYLGFVERNKHLDLMLAHTLLAHGLQRVATERPTDVVDYLVEDPRRLGLGDATDQRRYSVALVATVTASINDCDLSRLEQMVLSCRRYRYLGDNAKQRFDRRRFQRAHRLALLRALSHERLSAAGRCICEQEVRALPWVEAREQAFDEGWQDASVDSPMCAAQMANASDDAIHHLFEVLTDQTGVYHPRRRGRTLIGGSVQASREFALFAKEHPERALRIISRFKAGLQERPAGSALHALGEMDVSAEVLLECIRELDAKGFSSEEFRWDVAHCLYEIARRDGGLDEQMCDLVEGWIVDASPVEVDDAASSMPKGQRRGRRASETMSHSLVWGAGGGRILPRGNYPILSALAVGYLYRHPVDGDGFLDVLERHVIRGEDTPVWVAMMMYLVHLDWADRGRADSFFNSLLDNHPDVLFDAMSVRHISRMIHWLPMATVSRIIDRWAHGSWELGSQAAGELAMYVFCMCQDDDEAHERVDGYLVAPGNDSRSRQARLAGVAHTLIAAMSHAGFREFATPYLERVISLADEWVARALERMFSDDRIMLPDEHTECLLAACLEHPHVMDAQRDHTLVVRLQSLLAADWNPQLVARVAAAYLDAREQTAGQSAVRYSHADDRLVDVALTLHRLPETRTEGLELFERLVAASAYGVSERLAALDRHSA